jgi:HD-GYP domain-containing protein (c-di-GMP phosphodiesterase class II)
MKVLVRAGEGDINVGETLHCNVYDGRRRLLLRQGYVISSQNQIDALIERGVYFILNEEDVRRRRAVEQPPAETSPFALIEEAYSRLGTLVSNGSLSANPSHRNLQSSVFRLCKMIQKACDENKDACLSTILLQNEGRYSVNHQIHTAIACEVILRHMGYSPRERASVLGAALTMNIAMSSLQDALYFQKEELTQEQHQQIEAHLFEGVELLRQNGIEDKLWLDTVLQHHEFLDGSGYPQRLQGKAIIEPARILTIADIYCAKVTGRAYRKPLPANVALKEIFCKDRGHCVDISLSHIFIKELGIYPPGSFVRLANGEIAVVTHCGSKANCPIVCSIIRSSGQPYLNPKYRDCSEPEFTIKDMIASRDLKTCINRHKIWKPDEK